MPQNDVTQVERGSFLLYALRVAGEVGASLMVMAAHNKVSPLVQNVREWITS